MGEPFADPQYIGIIKGKLTKALNSFTPEIEEEIIEALKDRIPLDEGLITQSTSHQPLASPPSEKVRQPDGEEYANITRRNRMDTPHSLPRLLSIHRRPFFRTYLHRRRTLPRPAMAPHRHPLHSPNGRGNPIPEAMAGVFETLFKIP